MSNFYNSNISGEYRRLIENRSVVKQQVWPTAESACNLGCTFTKPKTDVRVYKTQSLSSSNAVIDDVTRDDWEAYLLRKSTPPHSTPLHYPSITLDRHVGKIGQPKRHYAHISFVPSARGLTAFTTDQVAVLEEVFRAKPFVTSDERSLLARRLGVSDLSIKIWYHNRRLLEKKEREELEQELLHSLPENYPFAHTEVLINQADKDGLVTLDQQSIDELVSAIDKSLPKDLDLAKLVMDLRKTDKVEGGVTDTVHELNSRAEVGTSRQVSCTQDWRNWEAIAPKHSFLGLLGIQSLNCGL